MNPEIHTGKQLSRRVARNRASSKIGEVKSASDLTHSDWVIVHRYRNNRSLLRNKRTTANLRARLEIVQPELEAEARARGIESFLPGRRAFIDRSHGGPLC